MAQSYPEPESTDTRPSESPERPHAPEIKPPSGRRRIAYTLFHRDTRTGRFLRSVLRDLLFFVILAGIGALAVYLLLYRPLDQQLQQTQSQAAQTAADLKQAQADLETARQEQAAAEASAGQDRERLTKELTRVQILRTMSALKTAQVAIQAKDKAAAARALDTAENTVKQASTRLEKVDSNAPSNLQALFTLVRNGLDRDLTVADQDLERLLAELSRLDNVLK